MEDLFAEVFAPLEGRTGELPLVLLAMPLVPSVELRREVKAYLVVVRSVAARSDTVDLFTAERIASSCLALIEHIGSEPAAAEHSLVQVACRYFVLQEDGGRDLHAPLGFDDDAEVFDCVAAHLGRSDLLLSQG